MPDAPIAKTHPHPFRRRSSAGPFDPPSGVVPYVELAVTTNFTFLTGASHPEECVQQAAALGHHAASIADTNTLAGIVRAHVAARDAGIPLAVGCRLVFTDTDAYSLIVYPTSRDAYANLCRLLTRGRRRAPKGECELTGDDLVEYQAGLLAIVMPASVLQDSLSDGLNRLRRVFDNDRLSLAMRVRHDGNDVSRMTAIDALSQDSSIPLIAVNDVHYHIPQRRMLQDVVTCIRHGCTIDNAGFRVHANAERHMKTPSDMARLFAMYPDAVRRTVEVADRAVMFSLDELRYEYPTEPCPDGLTPTGYLRQEAFRGAAKRYHGDVPDDVVSTLNSELALITELKYEAYFLTCYDIINFARRVGILCQGRGGAANSAVCYCLGITEVDPTKHQLLFARFVSRERGEPPDIDIDFEHERREEVIQYIYRKYGRDRAALTAEVISYRGRSAVREVGKVMGLSLDCVDAMARNLDRWGEAANDDRVREIGLNPDDPVIRRVINLTGELIGFPRHLSQHVGGFIITRSPLHDLVPIENAAMADRTVVEWDKDDIDAMGMLKIDCLGLGMLTCIRKAFTLLEEQGITSMKGDRLTIADVMSLEQPDDAVYEMTQRADTVGVFQIESRAQMSMLPRLRPRTFYDLVIEVAIVRPGPIQGRMVHPYLRRRMGEEAIEYPSEAVRDVLHRTLGVPLFQEQAMQLAIVAAGFTPDEADALRRAMAAWKRKGNLIYNFGQRLITGMVRNGYSREFAECCFKQIQGFSEYGFPESHAASFAILVYVSAWLKCHHPAAFAAALINSQPMGFYRPAQIIRDAKAHEVEVLPIDVNHSQWDCTLEAGQRRGHPRPNLRLGMRLAKGLSEHDADLIARAVHRHGVFNAISQLWRRSGVSTRGLRCLARADAFRSMDLNRPAALWEIRPLRNDPMPLFEQEHIDLPQPDQTSSCMLPPVALNRQVLHDYQSTGLSLKAHPVSFFRSHLDEMNVIPASDLLDETICPQERSVSVAGIVLVRQRPGTASGVVFITLEDETGIANLIVWRDTFERYRQVARQSTLLLAHGRIQRQGEVVHIHVKSMGNLDGLTPDLAIRSRDFH